MANILDEPIKNTKNLKSLLTNLSHRGPLKTTSQAVGLGSLVLRNAVSSIDCMNHLILIYLFMSRQEAHCMNTRAGLNPMQPMQLHWSPRLWGPTPWCLGILFIFARYTLCFRIQ